MACPEGTGPQSHIFQSNSQRVTPPIHPGQEESFLSIPASQPDEPQPTKGKKHELEHEGLAICKNPILLMKHLWILSSPYLVEYYN